MFRLPFLTEFALFVLALACCAGAAEAQRGTAALALDSLVVTAARWPQAPSELVADVTLIGPE